MSDISSATQTKTTLNSYTVIHFWNLFHLAIPIQKKQNTSATIKQLFKKTSFKHAVLRGLVIHHGEPYRDPQENLWRQFEQREKKCCWNHEAGKVPYGNNQMRKTTDQMLSCSTFSKPDRCHSLWRRVDCRRPDSNSCEFYMELVLSY